MAVHRLKHTFTAGELSPLMSGRVDFERYKDGCLDLVNAMSLVQGPATRRTGFKYIIDLAEIGAIEGKVRLIEFVFNILQAYVLVFFKTAAGHSMAIATGEGLVVDGNDNPIILALNGIWNDETFATFDYAQAGDDLYLVQSSAAPKLIRRTSHTGWSLIAPTFASPPTAWNETNGWPERITFHQQRLALAANKVRRQTVWVSKAGNFLDFGVASPVLASDAITFTLDSGTQNRIQWLTSGKSLNIGTLDNEWTVTGGNQTAITPTSVLAQRQSSRGSEANKPLLISQTTMFIEREGRTVNEFVYDYTTDGYKAADISILAPHLTEHFPIVDWAYQQVPNSYIWCVRADGVLLGLTYQRDHKVVGWHRHNTQGKFAAVCCIPHRVSREDEVWVVVKRIVAGQERSYLEKMTRSFHGRQASDGYFLDSFVEGIFPDESQTIGGLGHLRGCEVDIIADGSVHPSLVVPETGIITLNKTYNKIVVGLGYSTIITPTLPDISLRDGTSLGRVQRITNLDVDLYQTLGFVLRKVDAEGEEFVEEKPFRLPKHTTGLQVPLFSGWYRVDFPEGFDRNSYYSIQQNQPLPLTIRAIVDTVEVYE